VLEIAVVIMEGGGTVIHEWTTLVNPGDRNVGPAGAVAVHGIQVDWLAAAPTFSEIAGDLAHRLVGRVVVAHNARFDFDFIEAEYKRLGLQVGSIKVVDTMDLADRLGMERKLTRLTAQLGIEYYSHSALDDARATAAVLARLLQYVSPETFAGNPTLAEGVLPAVPVTGKTTQRAEAAELTKPRDVLTDALTALSAPDLHDVPNPEAAAAYLTLLEEVMEDGYISPEETKELINTAEKWGLSVADTDVLHREFLDRLLDAAFEDRRLTKDEREEVERAAEWLGVEVGDLDLLVREARVRSRGRVDEARAELRGKTVAFAGRGIYSNSIREALCLKYGIQFRTTVSDGCDLLVVGNADVENAGVIKARDLGVVITVERAFWDRLGERVPAS
jgi:DNA polymerase-3 subunit epsilon